MAVLRYNPGAHPPATLALVVLNVAVSIIDLFNGGALERMLWARGIDIYHGQWWRLAGCTVVHANLLHIAFNAYGIYVLGRVFEQLQGWRAILLVYVASALGGAALGVTFNDPQIPMVGASGAAYGLMGAVLGFFYVKTGGIKGIWQVPFSRQLAIWFLIGIGMSFGPGISLLGHVGGFVPGVLLGIYLEHKYERKTDFFHHASMVLLGLILLAFCVYAVWPWHRGNLHAARALKAYENGNLPSGDALLREAKARGTSGGGDSLVTHLELWRKYSAENPREFNTAVLRWPLTHVKPDSSTAGQYALFLTPDMIVEDHVRLQPEDDSRTPPANNP